jgi:excisionase family DNA binding protein
MRQYRSVKEVCSRLGVSDETLRRWVKAGRFPQPVRFGRRTLFAEDALVRFEAERTLTV